MHGKYLSPKKLKITEGGILNILNVITIAINIPHIFRREVKIIRRSTYLSSFYGAIYEMSTGLTIFLTILTEILLGNRLSAEKVLQPIFLKQQILNDHWYTPI